MIRISGCRRLVKRTVNSISTDTSVIVRSATSFRGKYGAYINGKEVIPENGTFFTVEAPATGDNLCEVLDSDQEVVTNAIANASRTYQSGIWSRADVRYRANVLNKIAANLRDNIPRLAEMEVAQTGRAVREMKAQVRNVQVLLILDYNS